MANQKVNELLKQLDVLNQQASIEVFIPSLQRKIRFKNLTLKQQKNLLKSSIDESLTKLAFSANFYQIIKENILDNSINVDTLYTFDRLPIAIALRANGIEKIYKDKDKEYNLQDLLEIIPSIEVLPTDIEELIEIDGIQIAASAPNLKTDKDLSNYALGKISNLSANDIKVIISELFLYEVVKFVKNINVAGQTEESKVEFSTLRTEDKAALVEKLPSQVTNKLLDFIKKYRQLEAKLTRLEDVNIEVDGSFFTI